MFSETLFCSASRSSHPIRASAKIPVFTGTPLPIQLIRDLFQVIGMEYFEKLVDQYLAVKLFQLVQGHLELNDKGIKNGKYTCGNLDEDRQNSDKVYEFALETIVFWAKTLFYAKVSILPGLRGAEENEVGTALIISIL